MKLEGNTVDLTLTEFTDKKIAFRTEPGKEMQLTMQWPEWECPVHGNVGTTGGVTFSIPNRKSRTFCWSCIEDKLIAAGVCELNEVEK